MKERFKRAIPRRLRERRVIYLKGNVSRGQEAGAFVNPDEVCRGRVDGGVGGDNGRGVVCIGAGAPP